MNKTQLGSLARELQVKMVRTRADAGATKVSAAKAPRKVLTSSRGGGTSSSSSPSGKSTSKDRYAGGNSYNPQPIPEWQKGIDSFFKVVNKPQSGEASGNNSKEETPGSSQSTESSSDFTKNGMVSDDDDT
ncbi:PCNA-associated factor-like isoform X2 [Panulirus ornatus]|uniref:PCNA-associated factor-like isoform X2 n=1 Tax=Panulirus ornatus TaxID=150431 RepID=UPI003A87BCE0